MSDRDYTIYLAMEASYRAAGLETSWEYPGICMFPIGGRLWATGLNGWHYATPADGESGDAIGIADDEPDLAEMTPEQIAQAWLAVKQN